jgi:integrase
MKKLFGPNTTLYGGRKGFTDLMLANDQDFVHISQWMGHSSIERTWKNYKSKRVTHYNLRKANIY